MGIFSQLACQAVALLGVLLLGSAGAATHALAAGLVASRFGLWTFDLAVSQMLQERVPAHEIGAMLLRNHTINFCLLALPAGKPAWPCFCRLLRGCRPPSITCMVGFSLSHGEASAANSGLRCARRICATV
jgi:hypothetical protein